LTHFSINDNTQPIIPTKIIKETKRKISRKFSTPRKTVPTDEEEDSESDTERVLFMEYFEEEGEVDPREELISALEELRIERKKIKSLNVELKEKEGSHNSKEI
jgi:hypothetical protein